MFKAAPIIEKALAGVRQELANHKAGTATVSTPRELENIELELIKMLDDVAANQFDRQGFSVGYIVVDTWPFDIKLGDSICAAEKAHQRAARGAARTAADTLRP